MIDLNFYMKIYDLKQGLMKNEIKDKEYVWNELEKCRSKEPVIYNIETTNACNMVCEMCPRTTMMTRRVKTMDMGIFARVIDQLRPFPAALLKEWSRFVEEKYNVPEDAMSENHFFLHIVSKVLVLHGYGDPLLDIHLPERIKLLTEREIPTYFSCNPANINIEKTLKMFENGLGYIKYSIEAVDDILHKKVRGPASNFTESYKKILKLLDEKKRHKYKTKIVITMLDLNNPLQETEFAKLKDAFRNLDVYIYLKSQDQKWYQDKQWPTKSIHWIEFCQFPWSSMTIKSNYEAVECVEDFNNEIILGDAKNESLYNIWNGERYCKLRKDHFDLTRGIKCSERCDMKLIGNLL